eukprot:gnl/TRDRNA2_/TRDRNA2_172137_c7_seq13.p1 gnl/TRDRNA2_/TRDRNA2_172137_c7~~gnl/TRDRNA2_/TRDRNA2_172137_c7_seq13.p1  ORF type:complete len:358 (-),score=72.22 gnl/TRDRNA2_/TRDRNA2_172137_c7_seq13:181-1254(-)
MPPTQEPATALPNTPVNDIVPTQEVSADEGQPTPLQVPRTQELPKPSPSDLVPTQELSEDEAQPRSQVPATQELSKPLVGDLVPTQEVSEDEVPPTQLVPPTQELPSLDWTTRSAGQLDAQPHQELPKPSAANDIVPTQEVEEPTPEAPQAQEKTEGKPQKKDGDGTSTGKKNCRLIGKRKRNLGDVLLEELARTPAKDAVTPRADSKPSSPPQRHSPRVAQKVKKRAAAQPCVTPRCTRPRVSSPGVVRPSPASTPVPVLRASSHPTRARPAQAVMQAIPPGMYGGAAAAQHKGSTPVKGVQVGAAAAGRQRSRPPLKLKSAAADGAAASLGTTPDGRTDSGIVSGLAEMLHLLPA